MTPADLDAIMPLERQVFKDAWTRQMYLADLTTNEMATYLVIRPALVGPASQAASAPASDWQAAEMAPATLASGVTLPPILAWGGFWLMVDEAHVATIASHPDWRGCGLGQWLMLALMAEAESRGAHLTTLEVRAGNTAAQRLYAKLGFAIEGRRRRYYRDGEDALIMTSPALADPTYQARLAAARQEASTDLARCFGAAGGAIDGATRGG
jgi:ribosomal-protein-alanine N-acetyltransferase